MNIKWNDVCDMPGTHKHSKVSSFLLTLPSHSVKTRWWGHLVKNKSRIWWPGLTLPSNLFTDHIVTILPVFWNCLETAWVLQSSHRILRAKRWGNCYKGSKSWLHPSVPETILAHKSTSQMLTMVITIITSSSYNVPTHALSHFILS